MMIDALDIAIWSIAPYPHNAVFNLAMFIGVPLALEAGIRRAQIGLLFPFVTLAFTAVARIAAGRAVDPFLIAWLFIGYGWGLLLRRYCQRLEGRSEKESALRGSAEERRAFLAGQNAVAMGADSVVDLIEGVLPVLGTPDEGSTLWQLADAWKARLCQATRSDAAYLGQALAEWSSQHNAHPDLSSHTYFNLPAGVGTILLTGEQETTLGLQLDSLNLRGNFAVGVDIATSPRPPGGRIRLTIGQHLLEVPADPARYIRPYDPGPVAFMIVTLLMLSDMALYRVAPQGTVPAIAFSLAVAWWTHRRLDRAAGDTSTIIVGAVMVGVTYAALATWQLKGVVSADGVVNYPVVPGIDLLGLLSGYYWDGLSRPIRLLSMAGAVAVLAASWALHPVPQNFRALAISLSWGIPLGLSGLKFSRELDDRAKCYVQSANDRRACEVSAAFERGRAAVIDLVRQGAIEARQRLSAVADGLPPRLAAMTEAKLREVDRRLVTLSQPPG